MTGSLDPEEFFSQPEPAGFWDNRSAGGGSGEQLSVVGLSTQITGAFLQQVGAFYAAQSRKQSIKSQAQNAEFQSYLANINARQAELDAQQILSAGRDQVGRLTAQAGQERSRKKVSAAARGVRLDSGSASEILATEDLVKEIDAMTINRNTVRAAAQARTQATNFRNRSLLDGVSAANLRATAGSINPALAAHTVGAAAAGRIVPRFGRRS